MSGGGRHENVSQNYNQYCLEFWKRPPPPPPGPETGGDTPAQPSTSRPPV
jgi:hypothetical protein